MSTGSSGKKVLSIVLGVVEAFIGIFSAVYVMVMFGSIDPGLGFGAGAFLFLYGVGLPVAGVILIAMNKFKAGGILLIIGSVLFIPIGFVGIYGGRTAYSLDY